MRTAVATLLLAALLVALPAPPADAQARTHLVRPEETLYRIALRYGVTVDALARANGLPDPTRIRPGQRLIIPDLEAHARRSSAPQAAARPARAAPIQTAVMPMRAALRGYAVQRGDTLSSIARRHGTSVAVLIQINGLRSDRIRAGQILRVPATVPPASGARIPPPSAAAVAREVPPEIGAEIIAPRPLRVRRGPRSYHTTLAIVAQGTPLHVLAVEEPWYQVRLPEGTEGWAASGDLRAADSSASAGPLTPPDRPAARGADLVREAMRYLGTPYVWGGESSRGVDCSGFVYVVFSGRMPQLARLRSFDYFEMGVSVDRADLQAGDLVFFTTYAPGPSHVGIYAGDGRFLHASSGARRVLATPLDDRYYAARYVGGRRLLNPP